HRSHGSCHRHGGSSCLFASSCDPGGQPTKLQRLFSVDEQRSRNVAGHGICKVRQHSTGGRLPELRLRSLDLSHQLSPGRHNHSHQEHSVGATHGGSIYVHL